MMPRAGCGKRLSVKPRRYNIYDGDGKRISQTERARTTEYLLDVAASTVLSQTTDRGLLSEETITYLNGLSAIVQRVTKPDGTTLSYLQYDGSGSVRQVTAPDGTVRYSQTFDPYGNLYSQTAGDGSTIGFGGGSHDTNGLVYSQGRYYAPTQGRFLWRQLDIWGQNLSQYQGYRDVSQATYNIQPMVEGTFNGVASYFNPGTWVHYNFDNARLAFDAYNAGERNLLKLYMLGSSGTAWLGIANAGYQLTTDVPMVMRPGYRWYDRLPGATRIGSAAVGAGDLAAMVYFPVKGAIIRARVNAAANATVAQKLTTLDEFIGVESLRGGSISEIAARSRMAFDYEPLSWWEYEELPLIADVRYSAARSGIKEHRISLTKAGIPQIIKGPVIDDIRFDTIPEGAYFEIAFGEGNGLPDFAWSFGDDPRVYYWKEWPEWLIRDKSGAMIAIADPSLAVAGAKRGMNNYLKEVASIYPYARIRFNLEALTVERDFTMAELRYALGKPALRKITVFYRGSSVLSQDELVPILKHLGVNR